MAPASPRQDSSKDGNQCWLSETLSNLKQLQDPVGENKAIMERCVGSSNSEECIEVITREQVKDINVTIKLSWNTSVIKKNPPRPYTASVPPGTVLRTILNKAAMSDPAYTYTSGCVLSPNGLGGLVTCIDGLYEDTSERMYWMLYENPKHMRLASIDDFQPQNGSIITFKYQKM